MYTHISFMKHGGGRKIYYPSSNFTQHCQEHIDIKIISAGKEKGEHLHSRIYMVQYTIQLNTTSDACDAIKCGTKHQYICMYLNIPLEMYCCYTDLHMQEKKNSYYCYEYTVCIHIHGVQLLEPIVLSHSTVVTIIYLIQKQPSCKKSARSPRRPL